jgi:hypothetical protein
VKKFKKFAASLTAFLFLTSSLLTPITEANIWKERKIAVQKNNQVYAQLTQPSISNFQTFNKVSPTLDLGSNISQPHTPTNSNKITT